MKPKPRTLFWIESTLAGAAAMLAAVAFVWRDWIEWIFGGGPDHHSGSVEWLIPGALLIAAIVLALLASRERRTRRVARSALEVG